MIKNLEYYLSLPYKMEITPDTAESGFVIRYPELPGCISCADTIIGALENGEDAKKAWIEAALESGVEINEPVNAVESSGYTGQFKLRLPKSLHKSLADHAKAEGISMNQYCLYLLTKNDTTHIIEQANS